MNAREYDVCIIGSGAAGLLTALELLSSGLRVCLVESGGNRVPARDPLYDMRLTGLHIDPHSRARTFGGTTALWAGRWKRLDRIDFEKREWVPFSGWPIGEDDLLPYYERAEKLLGISPLSEILPADAIGSTLVRPAVFRMQPKKRLHWGRTFRDALVQAPNVTLMLGTHVLRLEKKGNEVGILVCTSFGTQEHIHARRIVLACGGIENARLLLLSELGNDNVGRYFMDHPKGRLGVIETYHPMSPLDWNASARKHLCYTGYFLPEETQRKKRVLNSHILLEPLSQRGRSARRLQKMGLRSTQIIAVRNHLEQAPDPENRITLSEEKDPYGNPLATVHWTVAGAEMETMRVFHGQLREGCRRQNIGEVMSPLIDDTPVPHGWMEDASHHSGTTRMGDDQTTSVTDKHGRLHGQEQVYVAGSSLFPTAGSANPTATIAALSIRLADHLAARA